MNARKAIARVLHPPHLRRTGGIALAVGLWLTVVNQGPSLLSGSFGGWAWLQVGMNLLTPFVVANLGLLSRRE